MNENIIVPPPTLSSQIETGTGGVQTKKNRKKTLIRVFLLVILQLYFLRFKRVEHFPGAGGGGCNFLLLLLFIYLFIYFFFGGGGCNSLFL